MTSRPISIAKNTTTTMRIFIANFINFQATTTINTIMINMAQRGILPNISSIYLTKH